MAKDPWSAQKKVHQAFVSNMVAMCRAKKKGPTGSAYHEERRAERRLERVAAYESLGKMIARASCDDSMD